MATRDYVKRGGKPRNTRRTQKQKKETAFPTKAVIFAILLLSLFSSGLWFLANNQPKTSPEKLSSPTTIKNTLPPIPEEKWSYIETLEQKEIQIETSEIQLSTRPYLMQCGAYKSNEQADERKAMIAFQGLESHTKISEGKIGNWYRVILGPYKLKRDAERDRNVLRRAGIEPCEIWFWE